MQEKLEILIEANASGLTSQLKTAGQNIVSFVDSMNKNEVNWEQILSRSISPAIITGVASMYALAITQALDFQQATEKAGNVSASTLGVSTSQMNANLLSLAETTQSSIGDTNDAFQLFYSLLGNTKDADTATASLKTFANGLNISLGDAVKNVGPVLDNWRVNSVGGVTDALTGMSNALSMGGKIGFADLSTMLEQSGGKMSAIGQKAGDMSIQIEGLTKTTGASAKSVKDMFTFLVDEQGKDYDTFNVLVGNVTASLGSKGLIGTVDMVVTHLDGMGTKSIDLKGKMSGMTSDMVENFGTLVPSSIKKIETEIDTLESKLKTLKDQEEEHETETTKLKNSWDYFTTSLVAVATPLTVILDTLSSILFLAGKVSDVFGTFFGSAAEAQAKKITDMFTPLVEATGKVFGVDNSENNLTDVAKNAIKTNMKADMYLTTKEGNSISTDTPLKSSSSSTQNVTINVTSNPGFEKQTGNTIATVLNNQSKGITSSLPH